MKHFIIETKNRTFEYDAKNKDYAFAMFFKDIADDKIHLDEIGNIVILKRKNGKPGSEVPFRTIPLLFQMKLVDADTAVNNIMAVMGVKQKEAEDMLMKYSFHDSRIIPFIDELRRRDSC